MTETWKSIPAFEDYEASSFGRVRRKSRVVQLKHGRVKQYQPKVLAQMTQSGKGYKRVNLYRNKEMSQHGVHCLVAAAFFGPANGLYVNHVDFNVINNHVENLEYVTPAGNTRHAVEHNRLKRFPGEQNPMARLSTEQVLKIAERIRDCERDSVIARAFGIGRATVLAIRLGRRWSHVTGFDGVAYRVIRGRRKSEAAKLLAVPVTYVEREESTGVVCYYITPLVRTDTTRRGA